MFKFKLTVFFFLLGQTTYSPGYQQEENLAASVNLTVQPHICIAPRGESTCLSHIDVSWKSTKEIDLCLYFSLSTEALECWEQQQAGEYQHKISINKNLNYWVASMNKVQVMAESEIKFAVLKPHRKHKRRRNHLPWSIQSL